VERVLFDWGITTVMRCGSCGLVFRRIAAEMSEKELFALVAQLGDVSRSPTTKYGAAYTEDDGRVRLWKGFLEELGEIKRSTGWRLVDIGSAKGVFLDIARKGGWQVQGVEPLESSANYARQVFRLPVFQGTLEEAAFPANHFDAATMWDVIEHLKSPSRTVAEVFRVLKPGGVIAVLTPNHDSLITLLSHWFYRASGRRFPLELLLYPVVHHYYFSPRTLSELLRRAGFRVERVVSAPLHPEKCLLSTRAVRIGASVVDSVAKLVNRPYRIVAIASKPLT